MKNHIGSLKQDDNIINQQDSSHVFHDPVSCYMEGIISQKF
jgi:hypothetical protein